MQTRYIENPDGSLTVIRGDDVEPNLEHNKALFTLNDGYSKSRELRRAASIPAAIVEKWKNELGVDVFNRDHQAKVRALLDDPEWRYLRTAPGKLGKY